jgi:murein DD-endopeptidase MepM/ murein hydrolase activator NlpD
MFTAPSRAYPGRSCRQAHWSEIPPEHRLQRLLYVLENAPRTTSAARSPEAGSPEVLPTPTRRARRPLALAITVVLSTGAFLAASGSTPVLRAVKSSSDSAIPMAYDRDDVSALHRQAGDQRRALMLAWYDALNKHTDDLRRTDQQRASRGEPRLALGAAPGAGAGVAPDQYWRPTSGTLTQPFHPGHKGIDIGVPVGTPVVAAHDGVVTFAGEQSGYGNHIEVRHPDGIVTTYSHLSRIDVTVGQPVQTGQPIAASGNTGHSTGPHLHFEVRPSEGTFSDPIAWLSAHNAW